ncbi:hypothetical protein M0R45_029808 [Rubus argutus]|uniref:F-box domain-containing protein n=1 Tax=Rubus argutus TaxID=59490 RepID=A0AAW1WBS1_RUBAR
MEQKHILSAVGSSLDQGAPRDRFSGLPDNVAHHILSFLNFRALTRVGSLSKRCRDFYLSTPSLDIYDSGGNKQQQLSLLNSIDRFLVHRGDNKIQCFRISWGFCSGISDEVFRLITWIQIAVRCNVEVLEFHVTSWHSPETIELPSCIVLCESLRSLVIDFDAILKVPTFASFTSLQSLKLKHVRVDERFCHWMSSTSCECIKELHLFEVNAENMTVQSSSLESFTFVVHAYSDLCHLSISGEKLVHVHIEWGFYNPGSRSLNISAPNLKTLKGLEEC